MQILKNIYTFLQKSFNNNNWTIDTIDKSQWFLKAPTLYLFCEIWVITVIPDRAPLPNFVKSQQKKVSAFRKHHTSFRINVSRVTGVTDVKKNIPKNLSVASNRLGLKGY